MTEPAPTPAPSPTPAPAAPPPPPAPAAPPPPAPAAPPPPPPPPAPPADRWQDKFLPEDLRGDETLATYNDIPSMAKALVETKAWARGRVAIPADGDDKAFAEFGAKLRPEKVEGYDIPVPEGMGTETADAFRAKAFEMGLPTRWARELAAWHNQQAADAASKQIQAGKDQMVAIELEMGTPAYNQRLSAVANMFKAMGTSDDDAEAVMTQLQHGMEAGPAMKFLFSLAEKTGELEKVDGMEVGLRMGSITPEAAQAELDRQNMATDPEFNKRLGDPNSAEYKRRKQLFAIIAQGKKAQG